MKELPVSLQNLITSIENEKVLNPKKIKELVELANVQEEDLMPWADFGHPLEDGYGRKMVHNGGDFEVMVMSWNPTDFSSIHNHGYTDWGAVQLFGTAQHHIYNLKNNVLTTAKKEILLPRQIVKVNNPLIHQMGNLTTKPYLTLHIYGCDNGVELLTEDAKVYELEKGRIVTTTGGAFFNLPEKEVTLESVGLVADETTFLDQAYYLLQYYNRMDQTPALEAAKENVIRGLQSLAMGDVSQL